MEPARRKASPGLFQMLSLLRLRRTSSLRPAPKSQAEIDRMLKGWERHSESIRAKMARIGI